MGRVNNLAKNNSELIHMDMVTSLQNLDIRDYYMLEDKEYMVIMQEEEVERIPINLQEEEEESHILIKQEEVEVHILIKQEEVEIDIVTIVDNY